MRDTRTIRQYCGYWAYTNITARGKKRVEKAVQCFNKFKPKLMLLSTVEKQNIRLEECNGKISQLLCFCNKKNKECCKKSGAKPGPPRK